MANQKPPNKKRTLELDTDSDSDSRLNAADWPRFIIIESLDKESSVAKLSPFAIHKGIMGIAGTVKDVKKLRSGHILVECAKKSHADNLLRASTLAGVGIKASPHRTLNSSKGVIRTRDLDDVDEEEIAHELKPQGVLNVRRIVIKKDNKSIKTGTYILTFGKPFPPQNLKIGYLSVNVDAFIPNPLRCFQCQKFGHGKDRCKNEIICFKCGQKGHDNTSCTNQAKCSNCLGDHMAISKDCPVWKKEKLIQQIKTEKRLSYPEARRLAEANTPSLPAKSYAAVAKVSNRTVECQTELTWLTGGKPTTFTPVPNPTPMSNSKRNSDIAVQTPSEPALQKKKTQVLSDRVPKGSLTPTDKTSRGSSIPKNISINRYQALADIEMSESMDHRDTASMDHPPPKSQQPKSKVTLIPVLSPPKMANTILQWNCRGAALGQILMS